MHFSHDVHLGTVVNPAMRVAEVHVREPIVGRRFIGEHDGAGKDSLLGDSQQCGAALVRRSESVDAPSTFNDANDTGLVLGLVAGSTNPPTVISLVHLDSLTASTYRASILFQHGANLLE